MQESGRPSLQAAWTLLAERSMLAASEGGLSSHLSTESIAKIPYFEDVVEPRGPYAHNEEGQGGGDFSFLFYVESLNDKTENLQNREVILLFCVLL